MSTPEYMAFMNRHGSAVFLVLGVTIAIGLLGGFLWGHSVREIPQDGAKYDRFRDAFSRAGTWPSYYEMNEWGRERLERDIEHLVECYEAKGDYRDAAVAARFDRDAIPPGSEGQLWRECGIEEAARWQRATNYGLWKPETLWEH